MNKSTLRLATQAVATINLKGSKIIDARVKNEQPKLNYVE